MTPGAGGIPTRETQLTAVGKYITARRLLPAECAWAAAIRRLPFRWLTSTGSSRSHGRLSASTQPWTPGIVLTGRARGFGGVRIAVAISTMPARARSGVGDVSPPSGPSAALRSPSATRRRSSLASEARGHYGSALWSWGSRVVGWHASAVTNGSTEERGSDYGTDCVYRGRQFRVHQGAGA